MNSNNECCPLRPVADRIQRVAVLLNPMVNNSTQVLVGSNLWLLSINEKTLSAALQWAVTLYSLLYSLVKRLSGPWLSNFSDLWQLCFPLLEPQAPRCSPLLPKGKCLCVSDSVSPSGLTACKSHTCPCDTRKNNHLDVLEHRYLNV